MNKLKHIFKILTMSVNEKNMRQLHKNVAMSAVVCLSAGAMLVMNIMRHSTLMTITSLILVGGFALTGVLAGVFKKTKASTMIMAFLLTGVFTVFPISGGNEGFAALWLLLIPLFSISLFGLKIGFAMNAYFTILIVVLFYTPLSANIRYLYTENFMTRFPVLFLTDSVSAQVLALSNEYYYRITRLQVYIDDMTGAYNRKYFLEKLSDPKEQKDNLCIAVIDVNGLKETNDTLGHSAGDEMISAVPVLARQTFGQNVVIARMGGDEFALFTYGNREDIEQKVIFMKKAAVSYKGEKIDEINLSVGIACKAENEGLSTEGLYQAADKLMYKDKAAYYRQKGLDRRRR
ncbi:MAG: GGDEF domain-containing protein [Ruminococcus sp.]|nr:GGDEF domain-containing protein [Ruminococcus sp.]